MEEGAASGVGGGGGRQRKAPQNLDPRRDAYKKLSGYVGWLQGTIVVELLCMLALVVKGTRLQLKVNSNHLDSFLRSHNSFCTVNNSKQAFLIPPQKIVPQGILKRNFQLYAECGT